MDSKQLSCGHRLAETVMQTHLEPVKNFLDSQVTLKNPTVPQAPLHTAKLECLQTIIALDTVAWHSALGHELLKDVTQRHGAAMSTLSCCTHALQLVHVSTSAEMQPKCRNAAHLWRNGLSHSKQGQCQVSKGISVCFHVFCLCHLKKLQANKTCK